MATSGPNTGGTGANDNGVGAVAWTNAGDAQTSNNTYATCVLVASNSHRLKITNFGFSLPVGATILTIGVEWETKTLTGTVNVEIGMYKADVYDGSGTRAGSSTTTEGFFNYGVDLWGTTWTASQINDSGFGSSFKNTGSVTDTMSVDSCRITITYSTGIGVLTQGKLVRGFLVSRGT